MKIRILHAEAEATELALIGSAPEAGIHLIFRFHIGGAGTAFHKAAVEIQDRAAQPKGCGAHCEGLALLGFLAGLAVDVQKRRDMPRRAGHETGFLDGRQSVIGAEGESGAVISQFRNLPL